MHWFAFLLLRVVRRRPGVPDRRWDRGAPYRLVFRGGRVRRLFAAYSFGQIPNAIWWGRPWKSALKEFADGVGVRAA